MYWYLSKWIDCKRICLVPNKSDYQLHLCLTITITMSNNNHGRSSYFYYVQECKAAIKICASTFTYNVISSGKEMMEKTLCRKNNRLDLQRSQNEFIRIRL